MNLNRIRAVSTRSLVTLMLFVAIAALLIVWVKYDTRRDIELEQASLAHQSLAEAHAFSAKAEEIFSELDDDPRMKEWRARVIRHHRELERKYTEAALKPWEHVPPDPPPPPPPSAGASEVVQQASSGK